MHIHSILKVIFHWTHYLVIQKYLECIHLLLERPNSTGKFSKCVEYSCTQKLLKVCFPSIPLDYRGILFSIISGKLFFQLCGIQFSSENYESKFFYTTVFFMWETVFNGICVKSFSTLVKVN